MLVAEAISAAYRETAITAIGETPNPAQLAEGLSRLNGFVNSLLGGDVGRVLKDWPVPFAMPDDVTTPNVSLVFGSDPNLYQRDSFRVGEFVADNYPPGNSRILWRGTAPETVYFDRMPQDGARMSIVDIGSSAQLTLSGNGRLIAGQNLVAFSGPPRSYLYRADLGSWVASSQLQLTDPLPLADEFDDLIVTGTAIRLAPLDEINTHSGTMFIYERLLRRCQQRYNQVAARAASGYRIPQSRQAF